MADSLKSKVAKGAVWATMEKFAKQAVMFVDGMVFHYFGTIFPQRHAFDTCASTLLESQRMNGILQNFRDILNLWCICLRTSCHYTGTA